MNPTLAVLVSLCPLALEGNVEKTCRESEVYRHALVHGSTVNETLKFRIGRTDLNIGDPITFDGEYLRDVFVANCRLVTEMTKSALGFIGFKGPIVDVTTDLVNE